MEHKVWIFMNQHLHLFCKIKNFVSREYVLFHTMTKVQVYDSDVSEVFLFFPSSFPIFLDEELEHDTQLSFISFSFHGDEEAINLYLRTLCGDRVREWSKC